MIKWSETERNNTTGNGTKGSGTGAPSTFATVAVAPTININMELV